MEVSTIEKNGKLPGTIITWETPGIKCLRHPHVIADPDVLAAYEKSIQENQGEEGEEEVTFPKEVMLWAKAIDLLYNAFWSPQAGCKVEIYFSGPRVTRVFMDDQELPF